MSDSATTSATKHVYVTPRAPKFRFFIPVNGERREIRAKDGRIELDDEAAAAVDAVLAKGTSLSNWMQKVDYAAAEALVAKHRAAQTDRAVKGSFSTEPFAEMKRKTLAASQAMAENTDPAKMNELAEEMVNEHYQVKEVVDRTDPAVIAEREARAREIAQLREIAAESATVPPNAPDAPDADIPPPPDEISAKTFTNVLSKPAPTRSPVTKKPLLAR